MVMKTYTVAQAAEELGISPRRVQKLISDNRLKANKLSDRFFTIDARQLERVRERKTGRPKISK